MFLLEEEGNVRRAWNNGTFCCWTSASLALSIFVVFVVRATTAVLGFVDGMMAFGLWVNDFFLLCLWCGCFFLPLLCVLSGNFHLGALRGLL